MTWDSDAERPYYERAYKPDVDPNRATQLFMEMLREMGFPDIPPEVRERWKRLGVPFTRDEPGC